MKAQLQTDNDMKCRLQVFDDYKTSQSVISKRQKSYCCEDKISMSKLTLLLHVL